MKYRKKPVVIDAMQFDGTNAHELCEWVAGRKIENPFSLEAGVWIKQKVLEGTTMCAHYLMIPTLEGEMEAAPNDWIIRGIKGEFYPCKPDIFEASYGAA